MNAIYVICLVIWIIQFVYGIVNIINKEETNSLLYVLAVFMCILHYVEKLLIN